MTSILRAFVAVLLLAGLAALTVAATVSATFVKTLGQTNATDKFPFITSGGRIAVDEDGNTYTGSPSGYNPFLQKISADGKILWQFPVFGCAMYATAVDEKYLYTGGYGYYGHVFLQRRVRETGQPAPGWQYEWDPNGKIVEPPKPAGAAATTAVTKPATPAVPAAPAISPLKGPGALAVDEKYIFVADTMGNEIRRFEKDTGKEAPFMSRLLVVKPLDLAFTQDNTILVLTEDAVFEVDKAGKTMRVPVVSSLRAPVAMDVSRKTGAIYIAEAGDNDELVNRIRVYTPEGKSLNVEIGIGGDFCGKWYPLSFAFSSGGGDIALDPKGGLWVNGYGHRMDFCPLLTHLTPGPQFKPDLTLRGVNASGIIVDPNLDVYAGGSFKISWDDKLKWTSGLIYPGPANLFPSTLGGWTMTPVWSDGKTAIIASVHYNQFYAVNAKNGAIVSKLLPSGTGSIIGACVVGRDLFYTGAGRTIQRTTLDLDPPQPFMTLPENVTPNTGGIAVSPDQQLVFLSYSNETACYRRDGTQVWKGKGVMGALFKGIVFTSNPDGPGINALDAATGKKITTICDKPENGQPPVYMASAAIGSKDGVDYLFIHSNARIMVYRVTIN